MLGRQVDSLIGQTEQDWVCLVRDDASGGQGNSIVADILGQDRRFRLLPEDNHLGHYASFERLFREGASLGIPLLSCDQDDWWHPEKVSRSLSRLGAGAAATFTAMRVVDEGGDLVRPRYLPRDPLPDRLRPASLLLMNCVTGTSLAISPQVASAGLPFPAPEGRGWHDQWLAAVAARIGRLVYDPDPMVDYTLHGGQVVGDGLRDLSRHSIRGYRRRMASLSALQADLAARSLWVRIAARRLLDLPGGPDRELEVLARSGLSPALLGQLARGVRSGNVPWSRAALLAAGAVLPPPRTVAGVGYQP